MAYQPRNRHHIWGWGIARNVVIAFIVSPRRMAAEEGPKGRQLRRKDFKLSWRE